ncbi:reverse transcriptase domain-containing protein [Tanacetum coccineum]
MSIITNVNLQVTRWWRYLSPAESDSLPHAHAQTTKTYYKHQDSRIKKAQELKTKTSTNSDIQDLPLRYQVYQGRLLASFQDDAKYEHVGQDTRSQGGKDLKEKDLKISELKIKSKDTWERFKGLLRQCPHHGFSELHQLDTFYNSLNSNDQDALDSAAGGNFLDKMPQEGLAIIESKSKVRYSRSRANDSRVSTDAPLSNSSSSNNSFDMQQIAASLEDKMTIKMNKMLNEMKALVVTPAPASIFVIIQKFASSLQNFRTLPSQTVTNPRQQINAITTRSGKALEEPSIPLVPSPDVSKPQKEPEQNPETSTEKVQNPKNTAHVPSPGEEDSIFMEIPKPKAKKTVNLDPNPNSYPSKLPYPERMKVREHDKPSAQHSRFLKMFKQLRLEIGLKDALVEMPKFNKWLSSLLRNKEKLEEIAITTVNAECSAIIMNKVPEKLEDPGKFLIPCALQELDRTSALADSGASINLLPHSIYKKLGLEALTPTRMTLELANRSISHPMGIAEDVVVRVDGFTFLADFVVVNFEPPESAIILGRTFLRRQKLIN